MTVHFVGAGPGAADLLTLRAATLLAEADVVLYPGTYLDEGFLVHVARTPSWSTPRTSTSTRSWRDLVDAHRAGLEVVRLTSGDPSVYSALAEQTRRLDAGRRAVGRDARRPGVRRRGRARRPRADRPAGRAVGRAHPDAGALDRDAGERGAGQLRGDRRHARAAPGDHPDPRADGRARRRTTAPTARWSSCTAPASPGELVLRGTVADIADQVEARGPPPGRGHPGRPGPRARRRRRVVPLRPVARQVHQAPFRQAPGCRADYVDATRHRCPLAVPTECSAAQRTERGPHLAGGRTTGGGRADDQQALHVDRLGVELGQRGDGQRLLGAADVAADDDDGVGGPVLEQQLLRRDAPARCASATPGCRSPAPGRPRRPRAAASRPPTTA